MAKENDEKTVLEVLNTLNEEQKHVLYFLISESIDETKRKYSDSKIRIKIIKNLIIKTNMAYATIAEICGVSTSYIYKIRKDMKDKGEF